VRFDTARETVLAVEVERYLALVLAERVRPLTEVREAVASRLAEEVARDPRRALRLDDAALALIARLRFLAGQRPDLGLPTFPELEAPGEPTELLRQLCAGRHGFAELRAVALAPVLTRALGPRHRDALDRLAPERIVLPDGRAVRLTYGTDGPPVLAARIQQLFGLTRTPTVVDGRVPVVVHLLAPNGRPAQVTQDLASFWRSGYAEVRRQLRGRYPKHAWPEDPLAGRTQ
jgi:ATP-dependent helicase HrpB